MVRKGVCNQNVKPRNGILSLVFICTILFLISIHFCKGSSNIEDVNPFMKPFCSNNIVSLFSKIALAFVASFQHIYKDRPLQINYIANRIFL